MLENISLERPIAFVDVETTGKDPYSDRIVELSILKIYPDKRAEYKSHRVNPTVPIPAEAIAVHHITDDDVAKEPKFNQYAKSVADFLEGCDMAGFNVIRFDLPCLETEFTRAGVEFSRQGRYLVDSMVIFHQRERRDLEAAFRKYCGGEMENAHCAEEDAKASAQVLTGQLGMYEDLPKDIASLGELCNPGAKDNIDVDGKFMWEDGEAVCTFSKDNKGRSLRDIASENPGFLTWILRMNFSPEVKDIAERALHGEFPKRD